MGNPEKKDYLNHEKYQRAVEIIDWMSSKKYSPKDYGTPELIGETVIITRKDPKQHHGLELSSNLRMTAKDLKLVDNYIESELPKLDYEKEKAAKFFRAVAVINKVRRLLPAQNEQV